MFPNIPFDEVPLDRRWRCVPIKPGTGAKGWLIGPIVPAVVHWSGAASKPCRHAMSGGKLFCNCQEVPVAKRKLGYLPLLTAHGERLCIILSNLVAAQAAKLKHGDPINLHRCLTPRAPLQISVWPDYECGAEKTKKVRKYQPSDIQPWLLHLWGDAVLQRFFTHPASITDDERAVPSLDVQPVVTANNSDG